MSHTDVEYGREARPGGPGLLTAREVAERLNVSVAWVLSHASGRYHPVLPSIKLGRSVRFRPSDIADFVDHCRRSMERGVPIQ